MKARSILLLAAMSGSAAMAEVGHPERYVQSRSGEIQILPALTLEEIPRGKVSGVESAGGFVFDIEWRENKMTKMRVHSPSGGVCRIRSYAGIGSPLMRKAKGECPNPAIAATKDAAANALPESCFEREKNPLSSVCLDFDTEPGETLEFRGVSGNQDWTGYSAKLSDAFLATPEAARIAQNVLDWQLDTGGWPKNVPMHEKLSPKERKAVLAMKGDRKRGTIDNAATFAELNFLARMYKATGRAEYLDGVKRGIGFLLYLQYPNGGWPQCDPAKVGYWHQITFNDGAMVNVMNTLRLVYEAKPPFDVPIPEKTRQAAKAAFAKGVECILKTQIKQNGRRTVWCQQHDRDTLEPCIGRAFELPACCSMESMDIVRLLMSLDPEDYPETGAVKFSEIRAAIEGARDWYAANPVRGYRVEHGWRRPDGILASRLVKDPDAPPLWCRYYTLEDNRPFTGTRQGEKRFTFEEMERGENMSYMWFNGSGEAMAREYPRWEKRVERKFALAEARKNAKTTEWCGGKGNCDMPYIQAENDTWENPANWSNGVPGEEDTAVFSKDATLWSMKRGEEPYLCGRLVLKNGANVALKSNFEANGAVNPTLRPRSVEGSGTITLCRAGLGPKEGETLVVPKDVAIVAAGAEGRGSFLNAPARGRLVIEGKVSCPGNKLRVFDDVTLAGELEGCARMEIDVGVTVRNPPKLPPETIEVDGTSLQSAIDAIPAHASRQYIVNVAPGRYREKVKVPADKCNIRFVATDPRPGKTVISWNDTPATPGPNGKGLGTFGSYTLSVEGCDIEFDGFTIENTGTPERMAATDGKEQAGQCVALFVRGDRCAFRNCRILGWQDTVFAGGEVGATAARQYFEKCYIEGSVDFIFGGSVALFYDCELHSHQGGYVTAGSHAEDLPFGYVFVKCRVTCGGEKQTSLGRPWRPFANVMFVASDFGTAVAPHGWNDWTTDNGRRVYRSAEYGCTSKGEAKRPGHIVVGGKEELRERLLAAGFRKVSDIIAGPDDWRPMRSCEQSAGHGESCGVKMLESEMARMPVPAGIDKRKKPKWEYTDGLLLQGALAVAERHPEIKTRAFAWAQEYVDRMVTKDGEILGYRKEDCKLDCINPGKFAFDMYELAAARGDMAEAARLKKVLDKQFSQFAIQPRTSEGGFWHKTVYPHQMWLDGIYMGCPFYARYAAKFLSGDEQRKAFDDIANQFAVVTRHTYDSRTALYRHGWDEARKQGWAEKGTGQSRHAWGRALGWFAAAIVDTLDYMPKDHPGHAQLVKLANTYFKCLVRWQDKSGAWWQVADQPGREGNYLEATATSLIGYAMVKAWNRGYVGEDVRDAGLKAYEALNRDFIRKNADGTVSLTCCCAVAGLSADRDGSFEYYLREPVRDNDHKGTGSYMLLAVEISRLRQANRD